jgi:hypothetical protein
MDLNDPWAAHYAAEKAAAVPPAAPSAASVPPAAPAVSAPVTMPAVPAPIGAAPSGGTLSSPSYNLHFAGENRPSPGYHSGILPTDTDAGGVAAWNKMAGEKNPNLLPGDAFHNEPRGFGPTREP